MTEKQESKQLVSDWRELVAVVLLSVTAICTAWTGFQSSKWGGAMSISFSQASTARIEASRLEAIANSRATIQVSLFTQWLQAYQNDDEELTAFLQERFPEPLKTAFPVWLASRPVNNPNAAATPFDLPEYVIPESEQAREADARADAKFQDALDNNQRGDNYTILTVAFATVLFFTALSGRFQRPATQWFMLSVAAVGFVVTAIFLIAFPKLL